MSPLNVENLNAYTDDCTTTTSTSTTSTSTTSTSTTTTTTTTTEKLGELQIQLKTCHCNNGTKTTKKTGVDVNCKDGWKKFRNKCYLAVGDDPTISSINWVNARIKCWKLQGELASVPDQETKEFLTNLGNKVEHWIGGQKNEAGNWTWTDGTPWRNEFWAKGEPNNLKTKIGGILKNQTVVVQMLNGLWDDQAGESAIRGYFCETISNLKTSGQVKFCCTKT